MKGHGFIRSLRTAPMAAPTDRRRCAWPRSALWTVCSAAAHDSDADAGREGHYSHLAVPRPIAVRNGAGIEPSVDRRAEAASAESGAGAASVCA